MSGSQQPRRRSWPRWAAPLLLGALASAGTACGAGAGTTLPAGSGSCTHFVTTVATSAPRYARGQTVIISVTQVNAGPACTGIPPEWCGNLQAFATAEDAAREDVWYSGAGKTISGQQTCPFVDAPGPSWPAHYSSTQRLDWSQDRCAWASGATQPGQPNPDCPGTQVPAGTYRIVGNLTSAPVTITISG